MDTPMHLAICTSQIDIIYLLLRRNCDVFLNGYMDKNCVETAKESGLKELAYFMENYGKYMRSQTTN